MYDIIQFEAEHQYFLARIRSVRTNRTAKVMLNEFERKSVPVYSIQVVYLPKYDRVLLADHSWMENSAYRVLYECAFTVGESHSDDELTELAKKAMVIAETVPDPAEWRDGQAITN